MLNDRRLSVRAMVLVLWALAVPAYGAPFLVKDGQSRAEIIIGDKPARAVPLAAHELQEYLQEISGTKLPIHSVPTDGYPV